MEIKIQDRFIGENYPSFIIAEVGSNHNQNINLAFELIDAAAQAGVDAVKFQLFEGEKHYSRKTPHFKYLTERGIKKNIVDLLKEIELPRDWIDKLYNYAKSKNILFFCSITSREDIDLLIQYNISLMKLASFEIVDLQLIEYMAKQNKPMIFSTGLSNMEEIEDAYRAAINAGNDQLIFLQCASLYPAKPEIMNLNAMQTIKQAFNVTVGLSDHTLGIHIPIAAVAMGASVIEKHFTLDRNMKGPDHFFAIEPSELTQMMKEIRDVEAAMGNGKKCGPSSDESEMYLNARRSIHAKIRIEQGMIIQENMLIVKRPGYGIKPKLINEIIGKLAKITIEEDEAILQEMI